MVLVFTNRFRPFLPQAIVTFFAMKVIKISSTPIVNVTYTLPESIALPSA
jgi:hypothetical protein